MLSHQGRVVPLFDFFTLGLNRNNLARIGQIVPQGDPVDKRGALRVREAVRVEVEAPGGSETGITKDLGIHGLFLLTKSRWPVGTQLDLRISCLYWLLKIQARVAHHQADGVGFEFLERDAEFDQAIRGIVNSLLANRVWFHERRRFLKTQLAGPVIWEQDGVEQEGYLKNMNPDRAFIESERPPDRGTRICLYLPSPSPTTDGGHDQWEVRGFMARVARHDQAGFEIEFLDPRPEYKKIHLKG
jgi:hypothetical protein